MGYTKVSLSGIVGGMTGLVVNLATLLQPGTTSVSGLIMHRIWCACCLGMSSDLGGGLKPNC
jgi:hypothetical protein